MPRAVRGNTILAVFVLVFTAAIAAQTTPDLTGHWTIDPPAMVAAGGGGGRGGGGGARGGAVRGFGVGFNCGPECEIKQAGNKLTVTRSGQGGAADQVVNFTLDGTDSANPSGRDGAPPIVSKAKWDGAKLVITTKRDNNGTPMTSTQTLWIDGGKLVVETSSGRDGVPASRVTYTKG